MAYVTHSPFLQALGYAIINSLWQFALLWLIYVSLHTFVKLSSHQKYSVGLVIQAAGFVWFSSTFIFYLQKFLQFEEIYFLQQKKLVFPFAQNHISTIPERFIAGVMKTENLLPYLSVAYLIILFFLCFKWIRAYNITQTVRTKGLQKIDMNWIMFVKQLSVQLGVKREVKIYLSEMVKTPLTIGFFKPLILIPLASLNHLTTHQIEAVILHELAHIKRFDYLFNLFLALIDITLFFNPFAILISRHIKRERENCCDDWVLQYKYNPTSYANALLQIAICQSPSSLLALYAADNKHVLLSRIKRVIEKKENTFFNYRYQLMALFVMLSVVSSLALLSSWHNRNKAAAVSSLPPKVILKPMYEISNDRLYNPDFSISSNEKKVIPNEKKSPEKILKKNYSFNSLPQAVTLKDINNNIIGKEIYTKLLTAEADPVSFTNTDDALSEDAAKIFEASNARSGEVEFPVAAQKEQEAALIEDQLKELAKNLFQDAKPLIDQNQVIAQIKAAIDQLKNTKIQLNGEAYQKTITLAQKNLALVATRNAQQINQLRIKTQSAQCDINKWQAITKELRMQIEKAEKQRKKVIELNYRYLNRIRTPQVIYLPFPEKPHSFSFEFSTEPKVKALAAPTFFTFKKEKKTNKFNGDEDDKNFKTESTTPFTLNPPEGKDAHKNSVIVRI